jgi:hypothetical protein
MPSNYENRKRRSKRQRKKQSGKSVSASDWKLWDSKTTRS